MSTDTTSDTGKMGMFTLPDGKRVGFTFALVSSLFLLWGFCNGMIDVMDKHFQEQLHLTLAQSATVQFAHYLGYFLMSLPAGWLATKLGYKGGIIFGLLMVAVGGIWFIPATKIAQFWAFLVGVALIASGLTFLETIANPYTTVLGNTKYAATRINLAQSCNGIGWIFGPIAGGIFFYGKDAAGKSTGSETLYIPYAAIGVIVVILAAVFWFSPVPDVRSKDEDEPDEKKDADPQASTPDRKVNRGLVYALLLANAVSLTFICGLILWTVINLSGLATEGGGVHKAIFAAEFVISAILVFTLIPVAKNISPHNMWAHPHFSGATLAQFFYVAAQAGIFSFLINYMTSQTPPIPASWATGMLKSWFETGKDGIVQFSNQGASNLASLGFVCFLAGRFTGAGLLARFSAHKMLGLYALINVLVCLLVFLKLGWLSVVCVFASYFFMSIMFPTIFALGIHGLGARAKKASAFIVMAIMGGAILPKQMGAVADTYDISRGFIVPLGCFVLIALFGFFWSKLSGVESLHGVSTTKGH
jgi:FHS family L-fucose permease-like MFS transporter